MMLDLKQQSPQESYAKLTVPVHRGCPCSMVWDTVRTRSIDETECPSRVQARMRCWASGAHAWCARSCARAAASSPSWPSCPRRPPLASPTTCAGAPPAAPLPPSCSPTGSASRYRPALGAHRHRELSTPLSVQGDAHYGHAYRNQELMCSSHYLTPESAS